MAGSMNGRRILVTGASRGLGATLCDMLCKAGSDVWMISRTESELRKVSQTCRAPGRIRWSVCDVSKPSDIGRIASEVEGVWGALDVLINNAGIWLEGDLRSNSSDQILQLIAINLVGPMLTTKAFHDLLVIGRDPQVLYIGSLAGVEPCPGWPVYAASKYGLRGFAESIGVAFEREGIRVALVNPGGIDTQLYASAGYPDNVHQPWMMKSEEVGRTIMAALGEVDDGVRVSRLDIRRFS